VLGLMESSGWQQQDDFPMRPLSITVQYAFEFFPHNRLHSSMSQAGVGVDGKHLSPSTTGAKHDQCDAHCIIYVKTHNSALLQTTIQLK
jgi:hypothetical protein